MYVDLLGWEDTFPGTGRPQAIINKEVDKCDLFIGVLWRRWGQETGEYSSGFEEEFERARERRQETGAPEMWLAFKSVDPEQLKDAGQHLQKVIAFRGAQETARELLFKEFVDPEDWIKKLREWLMTYMASAAEQRQQAINSSLTSPLATPSDASATKGGSTNAAAHHRIHGGSPPSQLKMAAEKLYSTLSQKSLDSYLDALGDLERFDTIRIAFFTKSLVALYNSDPLPVRDINLLYLYRERLELVPPETWLLFSSVVQDVSHTSPGWYWFRHWSTEELAHSLFVRMDEGANPSEQIGALRLLKLARLPIATAENEEQLVRTLAGADHFVRNAVVAYVSTVAEPDTLSRLATLVEASSPDGATMLEGAKAAAILTRDPSQLLYMIARGEVSLNTEFMTLIHDNIGAVSSSTLRATLDSQLLPLRRLAYGELLQRGELSIEEGRLLTDQEDLSLREIGLRARIRAGDYPDVEVISRALRPGSSATSSHSTSALPGFGGSHTPDWEGVICELYGSHDRPTLAREVDWYSAAGRIAYLVLAKRDMKRRDIHKDIRTRFARIEDESYSRLRDRYGEKAEEIAAMFEDVNDFIRSEFTAAALRVLADACAKMDAGLARELLADPTLDLSEEAKGHCARILAQCGSATDSAMLVQLAQSSFGEVRNIAIQTAIDVDPGKDGVAARVITLEDVDFVRAGLRSLATEPFSEIQPLVLPLLDSDRGEIRVAALACIAEAGSEQDMVGILNGYLSQPKYYYNVVCWLDRIIYSPGPLRSAFRGALGQEGGLEIS